MFLSRNKEQPWEYRKVPLNLIHWEDKHPHAENHQQVRSVNSVCCETVTTYQLWLELWEQGWHCESSNGVSSLIPIAERVSTWEAMRCLGKLPRLENRSRAGVCPGLKWLKVITICPSELRGWYKSSFRYAHCKKNLQKWSCLEMGLAEGSHALEVLKEPLLAHADKMVGIWSSLTCHPFMVHQEAIFPFYCQSGTFHWPTAAIKISIWLVSLRNILTF